MTLEVANQVLAQGALVNIGQISPALQRSLERRVRAGELSKYRGHWDTKSPNFGLGPLKTIYVLAA